jgi:hypothetical protein
MRRRNFIMLGLLMGSFLGEYAPSLLDFEDLIVSILGSAAFGTLGIWAGYRFSQ